MRNVHAFPERCDNGYDLEGSLLRDWFAMNAPEDIPSWFDFKFREPEPKDDGDEWSGLPEGWEAWDNRRQQAKYIAWRWAYADLMMAARGKE